MKNEKVLVLTFEFLPHPGGIGTLAYQIASNFYRMGISTVVLATSSERAYEDEQAFDQAQPFPIYRFRHWKWRYIAAIGRTLELLVFCLRHRVQWIYCPSPRAAYSALICRYLLNIPYILVGIGTEFTKPSMVRSLTTKAAACLLAISQYTKKLMGTISERPVTVIPLGADVQQFSFTQDTMSSVATLKQKYEIKESPVILSVGRLNPRKGHDVTLEAIRQLKTDYPELKLIIVGQRMPGEEDYETKLYNFVKDGGLSNSVIFVPVATPEELKAFYALADVFVLSSRNHKGDVEGFGIVLIEANLMGTPVVASDLGGTRDAVEDGKSGFLYQCEDANDLAGKIRLLLDNKTMRLDMGRYGRERALREYNWGMVATRTLQVVDKTLSSAKV